MKTKITAALNVLAVAPAMEFDRESKTQKPAITKEGKPLFEVAYEDEETKTVAGKEFKSKIVSKVKSEIQLKEGLNNVVLTQYAMSEKDSKRVDLHYRIISVEKTVEK